MKALQNQKPEDVESPVTVAVDRETLRKGNPKDRELAAVLDQVTNLSAMVSQLSALVQSSALIAPNPYLRSMGDLVDIRGLGSSSTLERSSDYELPAASSPFDEAVRARLRNALKKNAANRKSEGQD